MYVLARYLAVLIATIGMCLPVYAQALDADQLKANYLLYFAELTEWPTPAPMNICARGASPLRQYLPKLEGKVIKGDIVKVLLDDDARVDQCRILYVSDIKQLTPDLLEQARVHHVLLVSDRANFAKNAGMVQFTLREKQIKLDVNLFAVRKAHLNLSSKLLRMANVLE